jgi:hypothetical protein
VALSTRVKSLERAEAMVCPECADKNEAVLVIRRRVVQKGDNLAPREAVPSECPKCGRKIRITRVRVERADKGPQ